MTVTPTIDTNNILNVAESTSAKSKYMSKSVDGSGFGNVFDKVSKNYSDNNTVKEKQTQNDFQQQTKNSADTNTKEKAEYKTDKTENADKSNEQSVKSDEVKENYEKVAGDENQEQKIQDEKQAQLKDAQNKSVQDNQEAKEDIQDVVVQVVEDTAIEDLKNTLLTQNLQEIKDLSLKTELPVQNVDMQNVDNIDVALNEITQLAEEQISTDVRDLLNASKPDGIATQTTKTEIIGTKENLLQQDVASKLQTQKQAATENLQNNSVNNTELSTVSKNNIEILNSDKNANMIQTEEVAETPVVKVQNDNALMQNVKELALEDKVNAKNVLDNKNLNQQKLDELDVKIKSVVSYGENKNNTGAEYSQNGETNQGFQMQQSVDEQAVRFELQANSDVKLPTFSVEEPVQVAETMAEVASVDNLEALSKLDNISSIQNFGNLRNVDTLQNVQTQNVQAPKGFNSTDIMSQIDNQLDAKAIQSAGTTKVSIILKPEHLGRLQLELVSSKDGLEARMIASSPQVKEILDKNLEALRETLGSQGVNVNNVTVKVAETQKSDMTFDFDQHSKNNQGFQKEQSQKSKEDGFQSQDFEQDFEAEQENQEEIIYTATEQTTTISGLNGRVAYKL